LAGSVTCCTEALVRLDAVEALATVLARVGVALLRIVARLATVGGRVTIVAVAFDAAGLGCSITAQLAGRPVLIALCALLGIARLHDIQTLVTSSLIVHVVRVPRLASAREHVDTLHAFGVVCAGLNCTLVNVNQTRVAGPTGLTVAVETVVLLVVSTHTIVCTRSGFARIELEIAVLATVKLGTRARVGVDTVGAHTVVAARIGRTLIEILLTQVSIETWKALALKSI